MARIEVLLRERAGYVARGLTDRVAQVDAALAAAGHRIEQRGDTVVIESAPAVAPVETAAIDAPAKRARRKAD